MKMHQRIFLGRLLTLILLAGAMAVTSTTTLHAEFRLPSSTGEQGQPAVASDAKGGTIIVWQERFPGAAQPLNAIRMQRFDPSGKPLGGNQRVDLLPGDNARNPAVDMANDGSYVIVWEGGASEGPYRRTIWARRFAPDGTPRGSELRVNPDRLFAQGFGIAESRFGRPAVSIAPDGGFVIVWRDDGAKRCNRANIVLRRFDHDGKPLGSVVTVNPDLKLSHVFPAVDHDAAGNFFVTWQKSAYLGTPDERTVIQGRRFDGDGKHLGSVFMIKGAGGLATAPSLAIAKDGTCLVTWLNRDADTDDRKISARVVSAESTIGPEFDVASFGLDENSHPSAAVNPSGGFTLVWAGKTEDPWVGTTVRTRRVSSDGTELGPLIRLGPATCRNRTIPKLVVLPDGGLAAVWQLSGFNTIEGLNLRPTGDSVPITSLGLTLTQLWHLYLPSEEKYPGAQHRRQNTVRLACLRFEAAGARPALEKVNATDPEPEVRGAAGYALASVVPNPKAVLPLLQRSLTDDSPEVRKYAARGLGVLRFPETTESLIMLLKQDPSHQVRAQAASALGDIAGNPDTGAALQNAIRDALVESLDDRFGLVHYMAYGALARLPAPPRDLPEIIFAKYYKKQPRASLKLIGELGPAASSASTKVLEVLGRDDPQMRVDAINCLAKIGFSRFGNALSDSSPEVRAAAATGLRELGHGPLLVNAAAIEKAARNEHHEAAMPAIDAAWHALEEVRCKDALGDIFPPANPANAVLPTPAPEPSRRQLQYSEYSVYIVSDRSFELTPRSAAEVWSLSNADPPSDEPPYIVVWGRPQVSPEAAAARLRELQAMSRVELAAIVESHIPKWREMVNQPVDPEAPRSVPRRAYPYGVTPPPTATPR